MEKSEQSNVNVTDVSVGRLTGRPSDRPTDRPIDQPTDRPTDIATCQFDSSHLKIPSVQCHGAFLVMICGRITPAYLPRRAETHHRLV